MKAIPAALPTLVPCRLIIAKAIILYDEYWKEKKKTGILFAFEIETKWSQVSFKLKLHWKKWKGIYIIIGSVLTPKINVTI